MITFAPASAPGASRAIGAGDALVLRRRAMEEDFTAQTAKGCAEGRGSAIRIDLATRGLAAAGIATVARANREQSAVAVAGATGLAIARGSEDHIVAISVR